jgi:hypothetical protein
MNHTTFAVSRFENRNGVISWRVAGLLHGVRIRKNFKIREDAAAEKAALEIKAAQAVSGLRSATTFLADGELRQAEDAFRRLEGHPRSILFYLDYALANYREQQDKPLPDAVTEYLAEKTKQHQRTLLSQPQLRGITNELKVLKKWFPTGMMAKFTPSLLLTYLERGKPSLKTYNNRRAILSTFFKFALQQEWITGTPVEKTPHHRIKHRRGSATTITAKYAAELMAYSRQFVPVLRSPEPVEAAKEGSSAVKKKRKSFAARRASGGLTPASTQRPGLANCAAFQSNAGHRHVLLFNGWRWILRKSKQRIGSWGRCLFCHVFLRCIFIFCSRDPGSPNQATTTRNIPPIIYWWMDSDRGS